MDISAISSAGSSKQVVRTSRILDLLLPEVLSEFMYSSRADLGGGCERVLGGFSLGLSSPNLMGAGSGRQGGCCSRRAAVSSVVPWFPASKTSPFLHTFRAFDWGEF